MRIDGANPDVASYPHLWISANVDDAAFFAAQKAYRSWVLSRIPDPDAAYQRKEA